MSQPLNILVIEDNEMNRRLARDVLTYRGHFVDESETFQEGIKRLIDDPPDIVLLDIQLPDGDGKTFLAELRRRDGWSEVPVIAVTASTMRGHREELLSFGFDGYISKPIDIEDFGIYIESFATG